jgi:glutamate synthase (ferredoxin)
MTGGEAFVLDEPGTLAERVNAESVTVEPLSGDDAARLRELLEEHRRWTGSRHAAALLARWDAVLGSFRRVAPAAMTQAPAVTEPEPTSVSEVSP